MSKESSSNSGVSLLGFIFLIFLTLKLGGFGMVANWSWWWVTAPLWLPISIAIVLAIVIYIVREYEKRNY